MRRCTMREETLWHEDGRGFFRVPAGTAVEVVPELGAAALDALSRETLERVCIREREAGGDPVLVRLEGRVRVVDREELDGVPERGL